MPLIQWEARADFRGFNLTAGAVDAELIEIARDTWYLRSNVGRYRIDAHTPKEAQKRALAIIIRLIEETLASIAVPTPENRRRVG